MKKSALFALAILVCVAQAADYVSKTLKDAKPGFYEAAAKYPIWNSSHPLASVANPTVKKWVVGQHQGWVAESKKEIKDIKTEYGVWSNDIDFEVKRSDRNVVSVCMSTDVYTGGAHPNHFTKTFNFAKVNGKPTQLKLEQLFRSGAKAAKTVNDKVMQKLESAGAEWLKEGTVTALTDVQLNRFTIDGGGMTWYLDPYEVGPYSSGMFEVRLTWAELGPDFNRALVAAK